MGKRGASGATTGGGSSSRGVTSVAASPASNPASVIREMYGYHVQRGYSDLGYNFVIDHKGVIYEGRYSRPYGSGG